MYVFGYAQGGVNLANTAVWYNGAEQGTGILVALSLSLSLALDSSLSEKKETSHLESELRVDALHARFFTLGLHEQRVGAKHRSLRRIVISMVNVQVSLVPCLEGKYTSYGTMPAKYIIIIIIITIITKSGLENSLL